MELTTKHDVEMFIRKLVVRLGPVIEPFGVKSEEVTIIVRDGNGRSRGGMKNHGPWMKIDSIWRFMHRVIADFKEYDHIGSRADIGNYSGLAYRALAVLVAHELAHVVQYCGQHDAIDALANQFAGSDCPRKNSGHSKDWQCLYAPIRRAALSVADAVASEVWNSDLEKVEEKVEKKAYGVSVTSKHCTKCDETKDAGAFYKHIRSKDGLNAWCKLCVCNHKKSN